MIPDFDEIGNLPRGIHCCDWDEFVERFGWTSRRSWLLVGLVAALKSLRNAGCVAAYIDGSFVTSKADPGDYDGCWEAQGVDPERLDPVLLVFDPGRIAQKTKFRGEFFPAQVIADGRTGRRYLDFFQQDRDGRPKGLIALNLETLP